MSLVSGFIDLQVNGFLGVDFSSPDLTEADFVRACRALLTQGTTAFLPTVITSALDVYERNLSLMVRVMTDASNAFQGRILGFHIEGPFISREPGAVGAHNPAYVRTPDIALLEKILTWADHRVRLLTVAAELPGADELARFAVARGITVSIGHSLFTTADLDRLADAGATALTHLGNGLPNLLPRHDNPLWVGLAHDAYTAMVIADGHHLPAPVLKTAVRAKGADKLIVVSDASPVAGLPPGRYHVLDNDAILEPSGRFHNPEKQCLVGSSATMAQCMAHLAGLNTLSREELTKVGVSNPLRLIGIRGA
ncbi:MAG: N-acetylglucosamine-6-phosphate deacetylase [Anaerolineae bacterium]|nr:N-acetylglucosamine-6-phosphate deacetylase [Anaerolineae bacterium]